MNDIESTERKPSPVSLTTTATTTVQDIVDAWAFVMDRLESAGPDPKIAIEPFWADCNGFCEPGEHVSTEEFRRYFSVTVSWTEES